MYYSHNCKVVEFWFTNMVDYSKFDKLEVSDDEVDMTDDFGEQVMTIACQEKKYKETKRAYITLLNDMKTRIENGEGDVEALRKELSDSDYIYKNLVEYLDHLCALLKSAHSKVFNTVINLGNALIAETVMEFNEYREHTISYFNKNEQLIKAFIKFDDLKQLKSFFEQNIEILDENAARILIVNCVSLKYENKMDLYWHIFKKFMHTFNILEIKNYLDDETVKAIQIFYARLGLRGVQEEFEKKIKSTSSFLEMYIQNVPKALQNWGAILLKIESGPEDMDAAKLQTKVVKKEMAAMAKQFSKMDLKTNVQTIESVHGADDVEMKTGSAAVVTQFHKSDEDKNELIANDIVKVEVQQADEKEMVIESGAVTNIGTKHQLDITEDTAEQLTLQDAVAHNVEVNLAAASNKD